MDVKMAGQASRWILHYTPTPFGSATSKGVSINATVGLNVAEVRMKGPFEAPASPA